MSTNKSPFYLEIDMRTELQELFHGKEFVAKWEPFVMRQSVLDNNSKKIHCTCYDHQLNEGKSDCPYCFGLGYIWKEIIIPGYRWIPMEQSLARENSYKSYGGKVGRLLNSEYLLVVPYSIRITANDTLYVPETDGEGGIIYPIKQKEKFMIAGVMDEAFDLGKKDFTVIGLVSL